jgi:cytochrome c oxidase subunit II
MRARRWLPIGLLVTAGLVISGCASNVRQDTLSETEGPAAAEIQGLWNLVIIIAGVVFVLVMGAVLIIIFKFRAKEGDDELPRQLHGNDKLEIGWTILPAIVLALIAIPTAATVFSLQDRVDNPDMEIEVYGQQWWWEFRYEVDGQEIVTANELVFPAGTNIRLNIQSRDVIHSFWLPKLNGKKDAVPGRNHGLSIEADEPGVFWGQCTEFCGLSHADMRIRGVALNEADWEEWKARQLETASSAGLPEKAAAGKELFANNCARCHVVRGEFETAAIAGTDENAVGADLVSGVAPDLTHLMSRTGFAGNTFDIYNPDGSVNTPDLFSWIRDAPSLKPMAPDERRGMPSFAESLSEAEVGEILEYLLTLGDPPLLPEGVELADTLRQ